ncbi:MAG: hypothetical protein QNJ70_17025 [Xenococcaceae cyanobacterium MO_207.B15]|nr:hypothetical protein [Xenococcaceae cyanobacterium MO_207.B15]
MKIFVKKSPKIFRSLPAFFYPYYQKFLLLEVLGCGTNNELIALIADGKVSEPEVNWVKTHLLNESELAQLNTIEGTKQGNLFSEQNEPDVIEWEQIKGEIDKLMKCKGWSAKQGKEYLIKRYGKSSRLHLTDEQLIEFREYLKRK